LEILELDKNFNIIDRLVICDSIKEQTISQEASYPFMIEKNGKLHLTYTVGRSRIEYIQISID
jgi:predicted neuraminidase